MTHTAPASPLWLPLQDVAPRLGLAPEMIRKAIELGQINIRTTRLGSRGLVFLNAKDVERYLDDNR